MAEKETQNKRPKWTWYQVALGSFYSLMGIAMFTIQGVDQVLWSVELDFSLLPHVLLAIGTYVIFGPIVAEIVLGMFGQKER